MQEKRCINILLKNKTSTLRKRGEGQYENNNININIIHRRRTYHDGMDSQDIQQINRSKLMSYKKLFWGYVTLNVIWGFLYGIYLGGKQVQASDRISEFKFSDKMQEMIKYYENKNKEQVA
jgi:hypothetical protein